MESRIEQASLRHQKGYNCAQAVACTYCDLVGVDEETMFKAVEALGLGMGCMEGTCGAVSGACVLAGFKNSTANMVNCKTARCRRRKPQIVFGLSASADCAVSVPTAV